jgi:hypothetical protein
MSRENVEGSTSRNTKGLHGLYRDSFIFTFTLVLLCGTSVLFSAFAFSPSLPFLSAFLSDFYPLLLPLCFRGAKWRSENPQKAFKDLAASSKQGIIEVKIWLKQFYKNSNKLVYSLHKCAHRKILCFHFDGLYVDRRAAKAILSLLILESKRKSFSYHFSVMSFAFPLLHFSTSLSFAPSFSILLCFSLLAFPRTFSSRLLDYSIFILSILSSS